MFFVGGVFAGCILLTGCGFRVVNTEGIKAAAINTNLTMYKVKTVKESKTDEITKNNLKAIYDEFAAIQNTYLTDVKLRSHITYTVNENALAYNTTGASNSCKDFISKANKVMDVSPDFITTDVNTSRISGDKYALGVDSKSFKTTAVGSNAAIAETGAAIAVVSAAVDLVGKIQTLDNKTKEDGYQRFVGDMNAVTAKEWDEIK